MRARTRPLTSSDTYGRLSKKHCLEMRTVNTCHRAVVGERACVHTRRILGTASTHVIQQFCLHDEQQPVLVGHEVASQVQLRLQHAHTLTRAVTRAARTMHATLPPLQLQRAPDADCTRKIFS